MIFCVLFLIDYIFNQTEVKKNPSITIMSTAISYINNIDYVKWAINNLRTKAYHDSIDLMFHIKDDRIYLYYDEIITSDYISYKNFIDYLLHCNSTKKYHYIDDFIKYFINCRGGLNNNNKGKYKKALYIIVQYFKHINNECLCINKGGVRFKCTCYIRLNSLWQIVSEYNKYNIRYVKQNIKLGNKYLKKYYTKLLLYPIGGNYSKKKRQYNKLILSLGIARGSDEKVFKDATSLIFL